MEFRETMEHVETMHVYDSGIYTQLGTGNSELRI